jgi:hypothetical protein
VAGLKAPSTPVLPLTNCARSGRAKMPRTNKPRRILFNMSNLSVEAKFMLVLLICIDKRKT